MNRREFLLAMAAGTGPDSPSPAQLDVWRAGEGGYHSYRIPALMATRKGTLLAFCEGRKNARSDTGDIDLVLRRSPDGGRTWTAQQVVADFGPDTIGNPCPVQDRATGTIWLPLTMNPGNESQKEIEARSEKGTRTAWMTYSNDDGRTWAKPYEITRDVKAEGWTWYATGPGNAIQLRSGRMLAPCDHRDGKGPVSHVLYSDDHGKSWKLGGSTQADTDECAVVELNDGSLLLNTRSYAGRNRRALARSSDGGLTWRDAGFDEALIEPVCQASFVRYDKRRLLFSNPASVKRERMTVRVSGDEGKTWAASRVIHAGPAAYSSLAALKDRSIGLLYERGEKSAYETITFSRFTLSWLMNGSNT